MSHQMKLIKTENTELLHPLDIFAENNSTQSSPVERLWASKLIFVQKEV
jgi:hypothetical protein